MGNKSNSRKLTMRYAGGVVKHLGLHMYKGAVPAIAELIANAWDADAQTVSVRIPLGRAWSAGSVIEVRDDGIGMSFDDCNEKFLLVGRDRRQHEGQHTLANRRVMGRKGLGKLGCFGIARLIEVRSVRDGRLTHFALDYDEIEQGGEGFAGTYHPRVLADEQSSEPTGTTVTLKRILLQRAMNEEDFLDSMARRFAILSAQFRVLVNEKLLAAREWQFEFRFPEGEERGSAEVPGVGYVEWWVGFTQKPVEYEDARGIAVMVRGRLAQTPFDFNLKGGVYGQHGLQYMVGEVHADGLDAEVDLVATGRSAVLWEDPRALGLQEWGQTKVKELLNTWADLRRDKKIERLDRRIPFAERIQRFPSRERAEVHKAIRKLASITTITDERLEELVDLFLRAYENEHFMSLIRAIVAVDESTQEEVLRLFSEWDVLEAVHTAQIVYGRVEVIRKFRRLIASKATEVPAMHDFLKEHPWLVEPGWTMLEHERSLDKVLAEHFHLDEVEGPEGSRRLDFFCLGDSMRKVVVEVKRPGANAGKKEIRQIQDYVLYLSEWASRTPEIGRQATIEGRLIVHGIKPEARLLKDSVEHDRIFVRTWENLLYTAETLHKEFLEVVKSRAPEDDPRIRLLEAAQEESCAGVVQPGALETTRDSDV